MSKGETKYCKLDLAWVGLLTALSVVACVFLAKTALDWSVLMSGILCVGLTAIGRREGYLIGLYNSISYSILSYWNGLYGEVYLNMLFFLPTGVIGYFMWQQHTTASQTVEMRQMSWTGRLLVAACCVVCSLGLGLLLGMNPNQNTPLIDATTNVLSVVATFLMMWRYKEQWLLYILINVFSVVMWFMRYMAGGNAGDLMVMMWSIYLLNAVFGYWRWHVGAKRGVACVAA